MEENNPDKPCSDLESHLPPPRYITRWEKERLNNPDGFRLDLKLNSSEANWQTIGFSGLQQLITSYGLSIDCIENYGRQVTIEGSLASYGKRSQVFLNEAYKLDAKIKGDYSLKLRLRATKLSQDFEKLATLLDVVTAYIQTPLQNQEKQDKEEYSKSST